MSIEDAAPPIRPLQSEARKREVDNVTFLVLSCCFPGILRHLYNRVSTPDISSPVLHDSAISCRLFFQPKSSSMGIQLQILQPADLPRFKHDMQEAFQKGAEAEFGHI